MRFPALRILQRTADESRWLHAAHMDRCLRALPACLQMHNQNVMMLRHGQGGTGSWLLVINQDRAIRTYVVDQALEAAQAHDISELQAVTKVGRLLASWLGGMGVGGGRGTLGCPKPWRLG